MTWAEERITKLERAVAKRLRDLEAKADTLKQALFGTQDIIRDYFERMTKSFEGLAERVKALEAKAHDPVDLRPMVRQEILARERELLRDREALEGESR